MSVTSQLTLQTKALLLLKSDLEEQRDRLLRTLNKLHEEIRSHAQSGSPDLLDASSGSSWSETIFASYTATRQQLCKIEDALRRIACGEFGMCVLCGGVIGLKRLRALPWAGTCLECQQTSEQACIH
jgi:DnaK suppressor protein